MSSSSSNPWPSPPTTTIHVSEDSGEEQEHPPFLFSPIREDGAELRSGATTPLSRCNTPSSGNALRPELKPAVKGRKKGVVSYSGACCCS